MIEILTICTGNICRSPLAEQLLRARLAPLPVTVHSAGTRGLVEARMTAEALRLAADWHIPAEDSAAHRSRFLLEGHLTSPDLILAMTRDHRRDVAQLAPARLRSTFTVREFARLAAATSDAQLSAAADAAGEDASDRLRAAATVVASQRGLVFGPQDPADDDVIDPYGRSWATYQLSARQLEPAIDEVVRVVRHAVPA